MELGLATFADLSSGVSPEQRMRDLLEEAELADQLGLDVFAVGEHHRPDFVVSSPAVALAAIAARTERIRLSSAVTVLSSDDPVRVFQQFAELDLLSGGRAEIMAGRGSFIESFPLFGYDLDDYDDLFAEKLELLLAIRDSESRHLVRHATAPPLDDAGVWPRPVQDPLPVWVAVGGTPAVRGARGRAGPAADAGDHRRPARALRAAGRPLSPRHRGRRPRPGRSPRSRSTPTPSWRDSSAEADAAFAQSYLAMMNRIGRERGWPPSGSPSTRRCARRAARWPSGSPEQVAEKILFEHELFGNQRYIGQMSVGAVAHKDVLRSIELFGTEVAPLVRAEVERRSSAPAPA